MVCQSLGHDLASAQFVSSHEDIYLRSILCQVCMSISANRFPRRRNKRNEHSASSAAESPPPMTASGLFLSQNVNKIRRRNDPPTQRTGRSGLRHRKRHRRRYRSANTFLPRAMQASSHSHRWLRSRRRTSRAPGLPRPPSSTETAVERDQCGRSSR